MWRPTKLGPQTLWVQKIVGPKIFLNPKNFGSKKIWVKKIRSKQNFGPVRTWSVTTWPILTWPVLTWHVPTWPIHSWTLPSWRVPSPDMTRPDLTCTNLQIRLNCGVAVSERVLQTSWLVSHEDDLKLVTQYDPLDCCSQWAETKNVGETGHYDIMTELWLALCW